MRFAAGRSERAYGEAIETLRLALEKPESIELPVYRRLLSVTESFLDILLEGDQDLLVLAARSTPGNYLHGHCVNVAILSLWLGAGLRWGREKLARLGLAAFLHDLGMRPWLDLVLKPRRLSQAEAEDMSLHVMEGARLVAQGLPVEPATRATVAQIILKEYSRKEGNLHAEENADELALSSQIIGVCDAYEALSHARSWRAPLPPHEAVKRVVGLKGKDFHAAAVRLFLRRLSPYPPGSYVLLSTNEIGQVLRVDPLYATRPAVLVVLNAVGERQDIPHLLDLRRPLVHIQRAMDETSLELRDRKLMAHFQANRWWLG